jgi:hypothetical protein
MCGNLPDEIGDKNKYARQRKIKILRRYSDESA